jgi:hypothetical protein
MADLVGIGADAVQAQQIDERNQPGIGGYRLPRSLTHAVNAQSLCMYAPARPN